MKKNKTIKPSPYKIPLETPKIFYGTKDGDKSGVPEDLRIKRPTVWLLDDTEYFIDKDGEEKIRILGEHEKSEIESAIYQYRQKAEELGKVIAEAQADLKLYGQVLIEKLTLLYGSKI